MTRPPYMVTPDPALSIAAPYYPKLEIGKFGWLWCPEEITETKDEWVLIYTEQLPNGMTILRAADDGSKNTFSAAQFAGLPYLQVLPPPCMPGAAFMATLHVPGGHRTVFAINEPGPLADRVRGQFVALVENLGNKHPDDKGRMI